MRSSSTNPIRYRRLVIAEAILVTLALHFGFFLLFGYEEHQPEADNTRRGTVTLLNLQPSSGKTAGAGGDFVRWLEHHDPAAVARGSSPIGYAALARQERLRPSPEDLTMAPARRILPEMTIPAAAPVPEKELTGGVPVLGMLDFVSISRRPDNGKFGAAREWENARFPLAVLPDGRRLNFSLDAEEAAALAELPLSPAVLLLESPENSARMPRFRVIRSSGRPSADLLALRLLQRRAAELARPGETAEVVIYWSAARNGDGKEDGK